jgi:hypothetical protein
MATQSPTRTGPSHTSEAEQKVRDLRQLLADAPELGRRALENALREIRTQVSKAPAASAPASARSRS